MLYRHLRLSGRIAQLIRRNYVSTVSVNASSLKLIKVQSNDFLQQSDDLVKLTFLDKDQKIVKPEDVKSLNVVNTPDDLRIDCTEPHDLSLLIVIPISSSPEVQIEVAAESSNVHIEGLPTKNVAVKIGSGDIFLKEIKGHSVTAETKRGNIQTKSTLLGKIVRILAQSGKVQIAKSQGEELEVVAESIKIDSCYSHKSSFTSTQDAFLKNVHGVSTIASKGKTFRLSGFTGSLTANLENKEVELQLADLIGKSIITSVNSTSFNLGLAEGVVGNTNFNISSNCTIDNYISDLIVYNDKKKKGYLMMRDNHRCNNHLKVDVKKGESVEIKTMSWVDFIKFV